jgi:hypothetical protein
MLHCITIRQPYAWLIGEGHKPIENRNGVSIAAQARRLVGQRIAIQASAAMTEADGANIIHAFQLMDLIGAEPTPETRALVRERFQEMRAQCGHIIATVELLRVIEAGDGDPMRRDRWRTSDRFGLVVGSVRKLATPVPVRGALGIWTLPPDVARAVAEQTE